MGRLRNFMAERPGLCSVIAAMLLVITGSLLLYWSACDGCWAQWSSPRAFVQAFGALLLASGLLAVLWDLFTKRAFAEKILDLAGLARDVNAAGITQVVRSFRGKELNWHDLLNNVRSLDLFVCWAKTWRNSYQENLQAILARKGGQITVVLPDPEDDATMSSLDNHFAGYTKDRICNEIREACDFFVKLHQDRAEHTSCLRIWLVKRAPLFSWYRIDGTTAVFAFYAHRGKTSVPSIVCTRGGHLFDFANAELSFLLSSESGAREFPIEEEDDG